MNKEFCYKKGEASDLMNIGNIYFYKDDFDNALKYYEEALKIAKKIGDKQGEADNIGNIGAVYLKKGDLDIALKYLNDSIKIFDKHKLIEGLNIIKNNINTVKNEIKKQAEKK